MPEIDYEWWCSGCEDFTLVGPGQTPECRFCGDVLPLDAGEPVGPAEPDPDSVHDRDR